MNNYIDSLTALDGLVFINFFMLGEIIGWIFGWLLWRRQR